MSRAAAYGNIHLKMTNKKIKILIVSDSAALHSGLAEAQRHIFIPLLQLFPDKYEIVQLGFFHFKPIEQVPWKIYNTKVNKTDKGLEADLSDKYGEQSFHEIVKQENPDIVFAQGDMWHFNTCITSPLRNRYKLITNYTVDGSPYFGHLHSDNSTDWGKQLQKVDQIVAISKFGKKVLEEGCPELKNKDIKVISHSIDLNRYPDTLNNKELKAQLRRNFLPPILAQENIFLCGFIGRNQFRKQNYKIWELMHYIIYGDYIQCKDCDRITLKEWNFAARESAPVGSLTLYEADYDYSHCYLCKSSNVVPGTPHPEFYMWIHTPKNDAGYNMDLHQRIWKVGDHCLYPSLPEGKVLSPRDIAAMISTWDAMYYPTGGEGCGHPVHECLGAGVPIVYSNYSAHAEMAKMGGLPCTVKYVSEMHHGIMRSVINTEDAVRQMLKLIESKELRQELGERGKAFAQLYNLASISTMWDQVFTEVMNKPSEERDIYAEDISCATL